MAVEEVALSGVPGKLQKVQRVCEDGGEVVPTFVVEVIEPACEGIEDRRENAKLKKCITDGHVKLATACAARCTMRGKLETAEGQATSLKRQLVDDGAALEKLASKPS